MPRRGQTNRQSLDQKNNFAGKPKNFRRQRRTQDFHPILMPAWEFYSQYSRLFTQTACVLSGEEALQNMRTRRTVTLIDKYDAVENICLLGQENWRCFIAGGIRGFLTRLGINEGGLAQIINGRRLPCRFILFQLALLLAFTLGDKAQRFVDALNAPGFANRVTR